MSEKYRDARFSSIKTVDQKLVLPQLFLSSEEVGWEGLVVRAFREPFELEGYLTPGITDPTLVLITQGAMYAEQRPVNGPWKGLTVQQGDLMLQPPSSGIVSELRWKSLTSEPMQTLHLQLNHKLISRTAIEVLGYNPSRLSWITRSGFQDPLIAQIGFALWRELEHPSPMSKLYAQTAAQMLAVHLLRYYTRVEADRAIREVPQRLAPRQLNRVMEFLRLHLNGDLSLERLAEQAGFSPYHFARLFQQTTGESPHQFVLRERIEKAQRLLRETDVTLANIALEVGFANQSHFNRVFKRYLGLTPHAYRQTR